MIELKNKNEIKPNQIYKLIIHWQGTITHPWQKDDDSSREYVYLSTNPNQDIEKTILNEIINTWIILGEELTITTILKSNEFIKRLNKKNIYYISKENIEENQRYLYNYENLKEFIESQREKLLKDILIERWNN